VRPVPRFELIEWVIANEAKAKFPLGSSQVFGDDETLAMVDWDPVVEEVTRHHGYAFDCHREVTRRLPEVLGVPQGEALLTQGTSEANALVMQLLCEEGKSVVVDLPAYQPLPALPGLYGARTVPVTRSMDEGWRLDLQTLQEAVTRDTVAIFTSNLHNPTGACLRREELRAMADIASDAGATLVVDEIFRHFVEDDVQVPPVREVAPEAVATASVSKTYAWASTRLGWISAPAELIQEAQRLKFLVAPTFAMPTVAVALQVLDRMPELRDRARAIASRGMEAMGRWVGSRDDVSWVPPHAGIICFPRFEGMDDTVTLAREALDRHAVMTSPGEFFGQPGHLRIGVGHPDIRIVEEGLRLLGETLDELHMD
jgi:aspartate/methionine/tyrosine aminotransferase